MTVNITQKVIPSSIINERGEKLKFDSFETVTENRNNVITSGTLINGSMVSDATHRQPNILNCILLISDNSSNLQDDITEAPTTVVNTTGIQFANTRSFESYTKLTNWFNEKLAITIQTKYAEFENYIIESLNVVQNMLDGLKINLILKEIIGFSSALSSQNTALERLGFL